VTLHIHQEAIGGVRDLKGQPRHEETAELAYDGNNEKRCMGTCFKRPSLVNNDRLIIMNFMPVYKTVGPFLCQPLTDGVRRILAGHHNRPQGLLHSKVLYREQVIWMLAEF
jgi:hypothetical protein